MPFYYFTNVLHIIFLIFFPLLFYVFITVCFEDHMQPVYYYYHIMMCRCSEPWHLNFLRHITADKHCCSTHMETDGTETQVYTSLQNKLLMNREGCCLTDKASLLSIGAAIPRWSAGQVRCLLLSGGDIKGSSYQSLWGPSLTSLYQHQGSWSVGKSWENTSRVACNPPILNLSH